MLSPSSLGSAAQLVLRSGARQASAKGRLGVLLPCTHGRRQPSAPRLQEGLGLLLLSGGAHPWLLAPSDGISQCGASACKTRVTIISVSRDSGAPGGRGLRCHTLSRCQGFHLHMRTSKACDEWSEKMFTLVQKKCKPIFPDVYFMNILKARHTLRNVTLRAGSKPKVPTDLQRNP